MYTITDITAIEVAINDKAPRPWKEVILEVYPEATIDCNGRAHAPYDGYECTITGRLFSAGEYLPMSEPEFGTERKTDNTFRAKMIDGTIYERSDLTRSQMFSAYAIAAEQSREYDIAHSNHIGEVGKKVNLTAVLDVVKAYSGYYGLVFFHVFKDEVGNIIFYKGGKKLGEKGSTLTIAAKVKEHTVRDGVRQTIIERPKVI